MHLTVVFITSLLCVCNGRALMRVKRIIGGVPAAVPPFFNGNVTRPQATTEPSTTSRPLVFVKRDRRRAIVNGIKNDDGTYSFLGIRYAEPPLRRFRFQRPRRLKLKGEIDATKFGPPCAQWIGRNIVGSEDCLFLNVFTPEIFLGDGRPPPANPVLVWIHGGNFKTGSAAQYVPTHLVRKGIVVVTLQYRLGSLGFLSMGRKDLPGNVGYFDIATGMRWVQEYIQNFGGDPLRITSGGQGSGANCASMMALNKHTRRKINGVVALSGSPISPFALDEDDIRTKNEVSNETGVCKSEEGIHFVRCMQKLPLDTILKADNGVQNKRLNSENFPKGLANLLVPGPAEEGKEDERFLPHFITESPMKAIKDGLFPPIPLLTGVTKDETGSGCRGNFLQQIQKKLLSPNFLQSDIFTGALYANNGLYVNKTVNPQLSSLFLNGDYLKFFTILLPSALSDIDKVIKHTTDAFFNLPAFIMSHLWSKKGNVFLYSFEHKPKNSLANNFLSGMPLVSFPNSQDRNKKGPEHGDDLMYLFDIRTLEGNLTDNPILDEADAKVREHFSTMVAEFVRSGKPATVGSEDWKPFSSAKGNYMIIKEQPKSAENFRKCEMGLWAGDNGILGSSDCSGLNQAVEVVTDTIGSAGSTVLSSADELTGRLGINSLTNQLNQTIPTLTNPLEDGLGELVGDGSSLLGGGSDSRSGTRTTDKPAQVQITTTKYSGGLLGGFGGGLLG